MNIKSSQKLVEEANKTLRRFIGFFGTIKEAEHGIFSYYLMKGLEGNADENKDKKITNGELIAYLKNNVSQEAFSQNRSQEPMLAGDPNNILISYR